MPVVAPVLSALIETNVDTYMAAVRGVHPLNQRNPAYFVALCTAIGTGIALGSPLITFTTADTGLSGIPPVPGVGAGVGIVIDDAYFREQIYTNARTAILSRFGKTRHDAYPPSQGNSGEFLDALAHGVATSVKTHFATAWILASGHPQVYAGAGVINDGNFGGLSSSLVKSSIIASGPTLLGIYFPDLAGAIADAYVSTIETKSTGSVTITGACVPSMAQVCGIPTTGSGAGTAT